MILLVATGTVYAQNEKAVGMNYAKASADTVPYRQFMAYPVSMKSLNTTSAAAKTGAQSDTVLFVPQHIDLRYDPFMPDMYPAVFPMVRNAENAGYLLTGPHINFAAQTTFSEHPFLLTSRSASLGVAGMTDNLHYNVNLTATNYVAMPLGSVNQYGIEGIVVYRVTDHVSLTAYGQLYNVNPTFTVASYPFVKTSRYGGFVTVMGDNVGVDVGVQRYYDPILGSWEIAPIITPKIKVGDNDFISLPVGFAVKNAAERLYFRRNPPPPPPGKRR